MKRWQYACKKNTGSGKHTINADVFKQNNVCLQLHNSREEFVCSTKEGERGVREGEREREKILVSIVTSKKNAID